jgi:hypothetical protein
LTFHVKRDHQLSVKIRFQNGDVMEVEKRNDGIFKCKCDKKFRLPISLRRHAKECKNELTESEQDEMEIESMDINNSDMSESMDMDDRIIPADCFGALISYENADYRGRRTPENRMYHQ